MRNIKDVLRLKYVRKLSHERIALALGVALELGTTKCSHVRDILASKRDQMLASSASKPIKPQDFYKIRFLNSPAPVQRRACKDASNALGRWQSMVS
jgi:hypothetical protein